MRAAQLLATMGRLDGQARLEFFVRLALEITVRTREAYFYEQGRTIESLKGLNELV